MMTGTSSASSGSTLTWLIDLIFLTAGGSLVWSAVCVHANVSCLAHNQREPRDGRLAHVSKGIIIII